MCPPIFRRTSSPKILIGFPPIRLIFYRYAFSLTSRLVCMDCYLPLPIHLIHYTHSDTQSASPHVFVCAVAKLWTSVSSLRNKFNKYNEFQEHHHCLTLLPSFAKTYFHKAAAPNQSTNYGRLNDGPSSNRVWNGWYVDVGYAMHRGTASLSRASLYGESDTRAAITSDESSHIPKVWCLDIGSIVHRSTASSPHASLYRILINGPNIINDECSYRAKSHVPPRRPLPSPFIIGRSLYSSQWHVNLAIKSKGVHVRSRPTRVYHRLLFHLLPSIRLGRLHHGGARASAGSSISTYKSSVICYRGFCDCWSAPLPPNFPTAFPLPPTQHRLHHHTARHTALPPPHCTLLTFIPPLYIYFAFYLTHSHPVSTTQAHPSK